MPSFMQFVFHNLQDLHCLRRILPKALLRPAPYILQVVLLGCAAALPGPQKPPVAVEPFKSSPEKYRLQAVEYEKSGELDRALLSWQVVASLKPYDQEVLGRIKVLRSSLQSESEKHFSQGLKYLEQGRPQAARHEFLKVLVYDPNNKRALDYLLVKLKKPEYDLYVTAVGDTPRKIARKKYDDAEKGFIVAYFNDLDTSTVLKPGVTLRLPVIEPEPATQPVSPDQRLYMAVAMLKANQYEKAVAIAQEVLEYDPKNEEATNVLNASYYEIARSLLLQKKYPEALKAYRNLDSSYRDVAQTIGFLEKHLQHKAEVHYRRGMKFFVAEQLEKAIVEWKETLRLNPEHARAKRDLEKTNRLVEKLRNLQ